MTAEVSGLDSEYTSGAVKKLGVIFKHCPMALIVSQVNLGVRGFVGVQKGKGII